MAVWPHGWKVISHGPSQRRQLGPVTESTSLSFVLLESPPDTDTSGGVASLLMGVASLLVDVASLLVGVASLLVGVASLLVGVASLLVGVASVFAGATFLDLGTVGGCLGRLPLKCPLLWYNNDSPQHVTNYVYKTSVFKCTVCELYLSGVAKSCSRE